VHNENLIRDARDVVARVRARYKGSRYKWTPLATINVYGAIAHSSVDEVGRIIRTADGKNRWRWSITANFAQRHRDKVACDGGAETVLDAAYATEDAYDELMRLNWTTIGNA
jgi:hypothetical protein